MGRILENWRVPIAVLFSAVLIVGAFILARGVASPSFAEASTETALLKAIAAKDSDSDGLPDWEESLYGTDPHNPDSSNLGMTDGAAVAQGLVVPKAIADISVATSSDNSAVIDGSLPPAPADDTLTAAFSKIFITRYLAAKEANGGAALSESDTSALSNEIISSLSSSLMTAPDFKSGKDLTVSGSGPDAMKAFATKVGMVLAVNTSDATTSELIYLNDAVQNDDASAIPHIASIAKSYRGSAVGLAVLPVPRELAASDLELINAMMRMSEIINDFTLVNTDPLATILAFNQYQQAGIALENAFIDFNTAYKNAGLSLSEGAPPGIASFVNFIESEAAKRPAATVPKI